MGMRSRPWTWRTLEESDMAEHHQNLNALRGYMGAHCGRARPDQAPIISARCDIFGECYVDSTSNPWYTQPKERPTDLP